MRVVFKNQVFLDPDYLSTFFVIFSWSHDLEQVMSLWISLGVCPHLKQKFLVIQKLRITGIWIR